MFPHVLLELEGGGLVSLRPGDLIGRHWRSALQLADERISEAHAMVSVRGGDLRLLALRGGVVVDGVLHADVLLEPGVHVELAPGMVLSVVEVHLPDRILGLEGPGLPATAFPGTCSLFLRPRPTLQRGHDAAAVGWFFDDGTHWFWTAKGEAPVGPLMVGATVQAAGWKGQVVWRTLEAGLPATLGVPASPQGLRVEAFYDTVRIFQDGALRIQVAGMQARLLSELAEIAEPIGWEHVAGEIWPGLEDRWSLRRRWDTTLRRLRRALADAGVRSDLITSDGTGSVSLVRYPDDEVVVTV